MDFLEFIPSTTVRNHVRESGYKLTATDATCIVYNSEKPLYEKLEAFQYIIENMPDCKINETGTSLHSVLDNFIKSSNRFEHINIWVSIASLELNKNFPVPFQNGDLIYEEKLIPITNVAITTILNYNRKKIYGFYVITQNRNIKFVEFTPYQILHAETINDYKHSDEQYMYRALSSLLKGELDLGLFLKLYDLYKQNSFDLSTDEKKQLKKLGIIIK